MTTNVRSEALERFRELHRSGTFLMPNPHDLGATRLLTALGFPALATTSQGFANTLGQLDGTVTRDQLVAHVQAICAATTLPVNVDSERCFPEAPGGVERTVELLAEAGAAGCSIEDWNPVDRRVEPLDVAVSRVARRWPRQSALAWSLRRAPKITSAASLISRTRLRGWRLMRRRALTLSMRPGLSTRRSCAASSPPRRVP